MIIKGISFICLFPWFSKIPFWNFIPSIGLLKCRYLPGILQFPSSLSLSHFYTGILVYFKSTASLMLWPMKTQHITKFNLHVSLDVSHFPSLIYFLFPSITLILLFLFFFFFFAMEKRWKTKQQVNEAAK